LNLRAGIGKKTHCIGWECPYHLIPSIIAAWQG
jgi:hypothetical protein